MVVAAVAVAVVAAVVVVMVCVGEREIERERAREREIESGVCVGGSLRRVVSRQWRAGGLCVCVWCRRGIGVRRA